MFSLQLGALRSTHSATSEAVLRSYPGPYPVREFSPEGQHINEGLECGLRGPDRGDNG
jgi:hypothetical protein